MAKVLVTGATGYIGSHVCKLLKLNMHEVEAWDTNIHGEYNDISEYVDRFEKIDITNIPYAYAHFDAVVHLAGRSVVPQSLKEPTEYYRVNAMGTSHMLDKVATPNFIFASTSSAWEMASPYAKSKVAAEDIIKEKQMGTLFFGFLMYLVLTVLIGNLALPVILSVLLLWLVLTNLPQLISLAMTILLVMALAFGITFIFSILLLQ